MSQPQTRLMRLGVILSGLLFLLSSVWPQMTTATTYSQTSDEAVSEVLIRFVNDERIYLVDFESLPAARNFIKNQEHNPKVAVAELNHQYSLHME